MTTRTLRATALLLPLLLGGTLSACGAGGFGSGPAKPPDQTIHSYVALGDGFTAAPYAGRTVGGDGCLRSSRNYPALAAQQLGITQVRDVSCTHATTDALTGRFRAADGTSPLPPQLDAVTRDTGLVSVGAGIEDHHLLDEMFRVCVNQPCAPGTVFYPKVLQDVGHVGDAVTAAVRAVEAKAPEAYIVVVGYPRLTRPGKRCRAVPPQHAPPGTDAINYVLDQLNQKLRSAALQTGSGYVDMAAVSDGHELCSRDPWVHPMTDEPGTAVAFHPLETEQRAAAAQLVAQVKER